jgi:hypothetical protein
MSTVGGVITSITTNTDLGVIYIATNGSRNGGSCGSNPSPSSTTWVIALSPANNQVYAQLLTAYATQATINIWGDSTCNVLAGFETPTQLQIGN